MVTDTERRDSFLFISNHLLLDFLNTQALMNGQTVEMLPDGAALARWLGAACLVTERESERLARRWSALEFGAAMEELRRFRESARQAVLKLESGVPVSPSVVKSVNRLLIAYPDIDQVRESRDGLERRRYFFPERPEQAFAPLADAFADLLTATPVSRIRKCASCVLHFYDTSKKGTRVWCSMTICGNRAKVAAFAERKRKATEADERETHKEARKQR